MKSAPEDVTAALWYGPHETCIAQRVKPGPAQILFIIAIFCLAGNGDIR